VAVHAAVPGRSALVGPIVAGLLLVAVIGLAIGGLGLVLGRPSEPAWVCDDTRYVDTVPTGRNVAGPPVSAVPGCGG
jgi:hypothetical protein